MIHAGFRGSLGRFVVNMDEAETLGRTQLAPPCVAKAKLRWSQQIPGQMSGCTNDDPLPWISPSLHRTKVAYRGLNMPPFDQTVDLLLSDDCCTVTHLTTSNENMPRVSGSELGAGILLRLLTGKSRLRIARASQRAPHPNTLSGRTLLVAQQVRPRKCSARRDLTSTEYRLFSRGNPFQFPLTRTIWCPA